MASSSPHPWNLRSVSRLKHQLLDAPVQQLGNDQLVFAGARNFMDPAELPKLSTGLTQNSENLAVESQLVDAPGESVRSIQDLIWRGRDANGPGRAGRHRARGDSGLVAD